MSRLLTGTGTPGFFTPLSSCRRPPLPLPPAPWRCPPVGSHRLPRPPGLSPQVYTLGLLDVLLTAIFVRFPHSDSGCALLGCFLPKALSLFPEAETLLCAEQAQVQRPHFPCGPGRCAEALLEGWGCSKGHWGQAPTCSPPGVPRAKSWGVEGWAPRLGRAYLEKGHWMWEGPHCPSACPCHMGHLSSGTQVQTCWQFLAQSWTSPSPETIQGRGLRERQTGSLAGT